jgi:hypothetical protein
MPVQFRAFYNSVQYRLSSGTWWFLITAHGLDCLSTRTTNEEDTIDLKYMFARFQLSPWFPVMLEVLQIFITKDRIPPICLE